MPNLGRVTNKIGNRNFIYQRTQIKYILQLPKTQTLISLFLPKSVIKNKRLSRLPIPMFCVEALKQLPSYQKHEYMFPARPNARFRNVEDFQKPHAWDIGKRFRRIRELTGINDLRIHDLRHFATTMLFIEGVSDAIIRKMTGHRSDELEQV